jgi:anti-sigma B factor antagonist
MTAVARDRTQIIVEQLPGASVVMLFGEHDIATVPALKAELDVLLATGANIIFDLSETEFIDSSVIDALLTIHEQAIPTSILAVAAPPGALPRRALDLVAVAAVMPVFNTREAALAYASSGHTDR